MKLQLRFFASLREKLRRGEAEWEMPAGATVGDVWASLCRAHPEIDPLGSSISFAVNREYVERSHLLHEGDEVAMIPPVSGG